MAIEWHKKIVFPRIMYPKFIPQGEFKRPYLGNVPHHKNKYHTNFLVKFEFLEFKNLDRSSRPKQATFKNLIKMLLNLK
jgi:hypothetical protein